MHIPYISIQTHNIMMLGCDSRSCLLQASSWQDDLVRVAERDSRLERRYLLPAPGQSAQYCTALDSIWTATKNIFIRRRGRDGTAVSAPSHQRWFGNVIQMWAGKRWGNRWMGSTTRCWCLNRRSSECLHTGLPTLWRVWRTCSFITPASKSCFLKFHVKDLGLPNLYRCSTKKRYKGWGVNASAFPLVRGAFCEPGLSSSKIWKSISQTS